MAQLNVQKNNFDRSIERVSERHLNVHLNGHDDVKVRSNTRRNKPQYVARFLTTLAFHSAVGVKMNVEDVFEYEKSAAPVGKSVGNAQVK